jgi:hypothetical protein
VTVPVELTSYTVKNLEFFNEGYLVEGSFRATVEGLKGLAHIQNAWDIGKPMLISNASQVAELITHVGEHLPQYLTSPDPAERALAMALRRVIGSFLEKEQGSI